MVHVGSHSIAHSSSILYSVHVSAFQLIHVIYTLQTPKQIEKQKYKPKQWCLYNHGSIINPWRNPKINSSYITAPGDQTCQLKIRYKCAFQWKNHP